MGTGKLEAIGIGKNFGAVRALANVSFCANPGEVHALIGENGAGKSTLLKILNGNYPAGTFEGKILLDGEEQNFENPHDALNKGIGFVPQEIDVLNELSVAENIFVGNYGTKLVSMKKLYEKAEALLKEYDIRLNVRQKVNFLSIGQKQQLMILRALSHDPKILILDESTSALGNDDVEHLFKIVKRLKESGKTIIFVTHKLDEIFDLTDCATVLRDGNLISTMKRSEYSKEKIISEMVGRKVSNVYPKRNVELGEEILRLEHITVDHPRIKNRFLVKDVSFSVRKGEVLGLGGLVGAGRSEVLETIFGCHPIQSGSMYIQGKPVKITSPKDALDSGIAFVSEDRKMTGLLLKNTIRTNITISNLKNICQNRILSRKKEMEAAQVYKEKLLIKAPSVDTLVTQLSGGNQQKVLIAKALHSNPQIVLLDEPTKGIDVGAKSEIYELINELARQGMCIVLVSSEMQELIPMSDRVVIMNSGRVCGELHKSEISQEKIMEIITENKGDVEG